MDDGIKRKRKRTGEQVIDELVNRKGIFSDKSSVRQENLPQGKFSAEKDLEPAEHLVKDRDKPIIKGQVAMDDFIAKRTLVGLEFVTSAKNFELSQEEPLGDQEQKGRHRKAAFMIKRSISGDTIKRNLLYVHSAKELIDAVVAFDEEDKVESGGVSFYRKEVTVHAAGIIKRIAFICKTAGSGGTSFSYRVLNIANTPADREVKNFIYQNTANGVPTGDTFPVDRVGDYPYTNKDVPIANKVVVEIEVNATSISGWKWEVIIDSEERVTDIPSTE